MAADVTLERDYALGKRDVFLSLTIGEGQFGTSDVLLDGSRILRATGPIGRLLVGHGPELAGRTLSVLSFVSDVNTATNRMSVRYNLFGGKSAAEFTSKGKVDTGGAGLLFEATFSLK